MKFWIALGIFGLAFANASPALVPVLLVLLILGLFFDDSKDNA